MPDQTGETECLRSGRFGGPKEGRTVGSGFSRNGFYVEYTLSHSTFPYAAAVAADNWDPSYFQQTLMGYSNAADKVNGGPAFGSSRRQWELSAPGFNAEHITAPLRKVAQTGGLDVVLSGWEVFTRLRHLKKPVEYFVMPDADRHGTYNAQNPKQILAVQESCVDWFDFWLNDREDHDPSKTDQYRRWRYLRELNSAGRSASQYEQNSGTVQ